MRSPQIHVSRSEAVPVIEAVAGDWALDDVTEYLCIDVGMYFAEVLRRAHPSLRWELWTYRTVEFHRARSYGRQPRRR